MKLKDAIGFDWRVGTFTIGQHDLKGNVLQAGASSTRYSADNVNALLLQLAGGGSVADHEALGAAITEPIQQVVEYREMFFPTFFQTQSYGDLEDPRIPIEDIVTMAFETHMEAAVKFLRAGYSWTRPSFTTWDWGIEVPWANLRFAGWNFLARQMMYASWDLARKHDQLARNLLDAAILATHTYNVSTSLTKASIDTVLKNQAALGYPVKRVLLNPATLMQMADFTWGGTGFQIAPDDAKTLLRTLHLMDYGGAQWFTSVHAPTNVVYFGGDPSEIGWHLVRGSMKSASDVDIIKKIDLHAVYDAEHGGYIGNALSLAKLIIV